MTASDVAAWYAAIMATAALGWQAWTWRQGRKVLVSVTVSGAFTGLASAHVVVKVVNRSAFSVVIETVQAEWSGVACEPLEAIAHVVEPRSYAEFTMLPSIALSRELDEMLDDQPGPALARVRLATGEWFESRPTQLFTDDRHGGEL